MITQKRKLNNSNTNNMNNISKRIKITKDLDNNKYMCDADSEDTGEYEQIGEYYSKYVDTINQNNKYPEHANEIPVDIPKLYQSDLVAIPQTRSSRSLVRYGARRVNGFHS